MTSPRLATTTADGRTYSIGEHCFPSVTSVLGILPKPGVFMGREKAIATAALRNEWQAVQAEEGDEAAIKFLREQANVNRDAAGIRGSDVHHALDFRVRYSGWAARYIRRMEDGTVRDFMHEDIRGYAASFDAFLKECEPKFLLTEETVYSVEHNYAGSLDAIVEIDGKSYVVDYKTGFVGESAAYQLAAYAYADWCANGKALWLHTGGKRVDGAFVLDLKDSGYKLVMVKDLEQSFHDFLAIRKAYDVTRRKKSEVLLRPAKRVG